MASYSFNIGSLQILYVTTLKWFCKEFWCVHKHTKEQGYLFDCTSIFLGKIVVKIYGNKYKM